MKPIRFIIIRNERNLNTTSATAAAHLTNRMLGMCAGHARKEPWSDECDILDPLLTLSLIFNATGTIISVSGAVANALGKYKLAFTLWIISNAILLILFIGVAMNWWILNSGAWLQVLLYTIFCCTSTAGFIRESKKTL